MDAAAYISDRAGNLVSVGGRYQAFVPHSLPPVVNYTPALVARLSEADQALGGVDHLSRFIPNPRLMMIPMVGLEALSSSRIEGTVTTIDEVFRAQVNDGGTEAEPVREVLNYLKALDVGAEEIREAPVDINLAKMLHRQLLTGVRGADKRPGELRDTQVYVGSRYVPPPPRFLAALLANWEEFLVRTASSSALVQCAIMHAQFEMIHPFLDGNGRVGRLLMTLHLMRRGCLHIPLLFLSTYFDRNKDEYYQRLQAVSQRGDWEGWLEFICQAVKDQADHGILTAHNLNSLREGFRRQVLEGPSSKNALDTVDYLFERPYLNGAMVAQRTGLTAPAARAILARLESLGIVQETTGQRRNRIFRAERILEVIRQAEHPLSEDEQAQLLFE